MLKLWKTLLTTKNSNKNNVNKKVEKNKNYQQCQKTKVEKQHIHKFFTRNSPPHVDSQSIASVGRKIIKKTNDYFSKQQFLKK